MTAHAETDLFAGMEIVRLKEVHQSCVISDEDKASTKKKIGAQKDSISARYESPHRGPKAKFHR
jgi:hypothetical protein